MNPISQPAPDWPGIHALGWNAFPLPARSKTPDASWKDWQRKRSTPEDHRHWQGSKCNAAIVTGSISGLVVLDCDTPKAVAEAERLGTSGAPRVNTAKGAHFYFRHPGGKLGNKVGFLPDMDLRGDGGFVVAPGSVHPSGAPYHWHTPPQGPIPPLPQWLLHALKPKPAEPLPPVPPAAHSSSYGEAALQSEIEAMRTAPEGTRNHQLNKSAFALAQLAGAGDVSEFEAKAYLRQAAWEAGLHTREIDATIASGWQAGQAQARASQPGTGSASPRIISASALAAKSFAPLQWVIPGILPEGLVILAGKPKAGKSYFAMQIAVAVASGDGKAWGLGEIEPGNVLYCALEDSQRRLHDRQQRMAPWAAPDCLDYATDWPRIGEGGVEALAEWCDAHPAARLVIFDTLRAIKPRSNGRATAYDEDAASVAPLLDFIKARPGLACVIVHHVRKMDADDPFDTISGTHGLTGIFDTLMVLASTGIGGATLSAQGRDLEPYQKALERDQRSGGWIIRGDPVERAKTGEREELREILAKAGAPMALADLAKAVGKQPDTTRRLLEGLMAEGRVHQPSYGRYALTPPQSGQSPQSFNEHQF